MYLYHCVVFFFALICLAALHTGDQTTSKQKEGDEKKHLKAFHSLSGAILIRHGLRILAFVYSFILLPLGLMEVGNPCPFSSLRKHGGSNHFLLPTSLLQTVFHDVKVYPPDANVFGEVFGGGVVRFEGTNSSHLTGPFGLQYPGETFAHNPKAVTLLKSAGHIGRQWSPNSYTSAIGNKMYNSNNRYNSLQRPEGFQKTINHPINYPGDVYSDQLSRNDKVARVKLLGAPFGPYTIAAAGARRLIRDARVYHQHEEFDISGAILDGTTGDELWRANSAAAEFTLKRRFDEMTGLEKITCIDTRSNNPCSEWVSLTLLAEPTKKLFARIMSRLLLHMPIPIVKENEGHHRRITCP